MNRIDINELLLTLIYLKFEHNNAVVVSLGIIRLNAKRFFIVR
jgi:hypothetical protein